MTQEEKRKYLIRELLSEQPQDKNIEIPGDTKEQKRLLRSLMNIREGIKIIQGKSKHNKKRFPIPGAFLQHVFGDLIPLIC